MELLELVKRRYSCRNYQPTSVEKEKLDYIMECVRFAPSAVNKQPWLQLLSLPLSCMMKNGLDPMASITAISADEPKGKKRKDIEEICK